MHVHDEHFVSVVLQCVYVRVYVLLCNPFSTIDKITGMLNMFCFSLRTLNRITYPYTVVLYFFLFYLFFFLFETFRFIFRFLLSSRLH